MKNKYRIYIANIIALTATWLVIYIAWKVIGNEDCSGRHCLGYFPLLLIASLILIICSGVFSLRIKSTIARCYIDNVISYTCLIKRPLIFTLFLSFTFIGVVTYNSISPANVIEWLYLLLLAVAMCIPTVTFLTVWYVIAGRHNNAFKIDREKRGALT